MKERERKAVVIDLLPQAAYRLELEDRRQVLAHAAGAGQKNFVRLRPGDSVVVELSPHDPARGRITKLLKGRQPAAGEDAGSDRAKEEQEARRS